MSFADLLTLLGYILADNVAVLAAILISLLVLKQIKDDIRPIFLAMVGPLTKQAQSNAVAWTVGIAMCILACMGALTEVAIQMKWTYVAILCKVLGPGLATGVAIANRTAQAGPVVNNSTGNTTPPFPKAAASAGSPVTGAPPV